ncbi:MAG: hypothetical protein MJZ26_09170 [Fibrobacter sp.]|nr:hypothetical protein [Fibrobacter sp.]
MKTLKTKEAVSAYNLLKAAKINKVAVDADKFNIIKTTRALKKVAEDFESFRADSVEALKGENHEEILELAQRWQKEEEDGQKKTLTPEERVAVNSYFEKYNKSINECLKEEAEKENEIDVKEITDESFMQLIGGNDWNTEQMIAIQDVIC